MAWVIRAYWAQEWLSTCSAYPDGRVSFDWHHKPGSAHQFETKAAAEAIAFLSGGAVEERE